MANKKLQYESGIEGKDRYKYNRKMKIRIRSSEKNEGNAKDG